MSVWTNLFCLRGTSQIIVNDHNIDITYPQQWMVSGYKNFIIDYKMQLKTKMLKSHKIMYYASYNAMQCINQKR